MRKVLTVLVIGSLLIPVLSMAQLQQPPTVPLTINVVLGWLDTAATWIFSIVMVVALIMLLIGAFTFLTAAGAPEKISKARDYVIYALIGVAVALLARGIIAMVRSFVGA